MILESFGRDIAPWNVIVPAFKNEFAQQLRVPIELHDAALETAREDDPQSELAFAEYLQALYAKHPPDLVIPVGAPATQFWWRHRQSLFPSAPVVIGGIEGRILQSLSLSSNDTAVAVQVDIARACFDPIFELFPATTNVVMVIGSSRLEQYWLAECQRVWSSFGERGRLVPLNALSLPEICRHVANLPPRSVATCWIFWVDATGVPHEHTRALDQICAVANVPVLGLFEEQLGHGIVGGRLISSESVGREAARLAARVLGGERAGSIAPVVLRPGPPVFDWRELQRWNIDERRLPPGSVVRFRRPSPWQQYRWYVVGALGIMLAQAATILGLLLQRTRRRRAEAAAYQVGGRLITAQEEERRRIARDMHDDLNQRLALLSVELDLARQAEGTSPLTPRLEEMAQQVKDLSSEVHKLSYQLHPVKLDQLGLVTAARAFCKEFAAQSGLPIEFTDQDVPRELPAETALCAFRVLQEALGNTLRHSRATEAKADLRRVNHHLRLAVWDNGTGFDLAQAGGFRGLGLLSMEERARLVRGKLNVQTAPGRGTRVELTVPVGLGSSEPEEIS